MLSEASGSNRSWKNRIFRFLKVDRCLEEGSPSVVRVGGLGQEIVWNELERRPVAECETIISELQRKELRSSVPDEITVNSRSKWAISRTKK